MIMKRTKTDKKKLFLFYLTTNNNVYYKVKHETAKNAFVQCSQNIP